jgi:hypothetical protein
MTSDAMSAEGIKAQMTHPIFTRVFGKPTHKQIKTVIHKLLANLMAISCPWGHSKGHLGLLQDPAIYLAHNGEAFNIPHIEPPAYPVIPAGTTTADREKLRTTNAAACKAWNIYKMVITIIRDQFAMAIDNLYYTVLDNPTEGLNAVDLRTLVMHILNTYAQIRASTSIETVSVNRAASRRFVNILDCLRTAFLSFLHLASSPFCLMMQRTATMRIWYSLVFPRE